MRNVASVVYCTLYIVLYNCTFTVHDKGAVSWLWHCLLANWELPERRQERKQEWGKIPLKTTSSYHDKGGRLTTVWRLPAATMTGGWSKTMVGKASFVWFQGWVTCTSFPPHPIYTSIHLSNLYIVGDNPHFTSLWSPRHNNLGMCTYSRIMVRLW